MKDKSVVVVDGSNIATEGRTLPSLAQLDRAVQAFLSDRPHDSCIVVVDATFEHRIDPTERQIYADAEAAGELVTPPAGTIGRGDKFLLEIAYRASATVFSNDSFQEFHGEYEWLFKEGRLIGGKDIPGVGWIFTERSPVRGPRSRMATRDARKRSNDGETPPAKRQPRALKEAAPKRASKAASLPMPVPTSPPPVAPSPAPGALVSASAGAGEGGKPSDRHVGMHPVNEGLPFIRFISEHPVGAIVEGEVAEFSSHGAYVYVGDARCYLPLKYMSDPPPRRARDLLEKGQIGKFVVQAFYGPRRAIDLAMPDFGPVPALQVSAAPAPIRAAPARKKATAKKTPAVENAPVKKTTAKKSTAKKAIKAVEVVPSPAPAVPITRKAAPTKKKATATKAVSSKTASKVVASKKAAAPTRTPAAKKAAPKKTAAKKATAAVAVLPAEPAKATTKAGSRSRAKSIRKA